MNLYEAHVMDHFRNPRNRGTLEDAGIVFKDSNPLCGDIITINLVHDGKGRITAARHFTQGCAISQAAASMVFEDLEGKTFKQALDLPKADVLSQFGSELSVSRVKCALLALSALKKAIVSHERERGEHYA